MAGIAATASIAINAANNISFFFVNFFYPLFCPFQAKVSTR
jgi:hypothetical protein